MNKLFTKVAALSVGLAMAIGVGVALGGQRKALSVKATDTTFTVTSAADLSKDDVDVSFDKSSGSTAPTWYAAGLRLYGSNTVTISSTTETITGITFNWEKQGSKAFATVTANVGDYEHPTTTGEGVWSGSSNSVVFTLGSTGQLQLNTFSVTHGGSGPVQTFTITYDANGGSGEMESTVGANPAVATCTFTAPDGKVFERWNDAADGSGTDYAVGAKPGDNLDLYAIWVDKPECVTLADIGVNAETSAYTTTVETVDIVDGSDTYTLNYYHGKKQGNAIILEKSTDAFISNHTAMPHKITSVEVFTNTTASGSATYDVAFGTSEFTAAAEGVGAVNITGGNSHVFENNAVVGAKYFCITLGAAYNGQVLKIVVNYEAEKKASAIEDNYHNEGPFTLYAGGASKTFMFYDATGEYHERIYDDITWEVGDSTIAKLTLNTSECYLEGLKVGTTTLSGVAPGYEKTTVTIVVEEDPALPEMEIWDNTWKLSDGSGYWWSATEDLYWFYAHPAGDTEKSAEDREILTADSWTSSDTSVATIRTATGGQGVVTCVKPGSTTLTVSKSGYQSVSVTVTFNAGAVSELHVSGSMTKTAYTTDDTAWDPTGLVAKAYHGNTGWEDDVTSEVSWSFDPLVPAEGVTSVVATATYVDEDQDEYTGSSSAQSVTVTVKHAGTAADPFTVAEGIAKCQEIGTTASGDWYVKGYISAITSTAADATQYGNATFNLSDDGNNTNFLIAFQVKYIDGEAFTAETFAELKVGYIAVVHGALLNYKGNTPEFNGKGSSSLVSLEEPSTGDIDVTFEPETSFEIGQNGSFSALTTATNPTYTWSVEDSSILSVDASTGSFEALALGTTKVTVNVSADEGDGEAFAFITVNGGSYMSVDDVNEIAASLESGVTTEYYVYIEGYVSEFATSTKDDKPRAFDIKNLGETQSIMIYTNVDPYDAFVDGLEIGSYVRIKGNIQNYNGKYEIVNPVRVNVEYVAMTFAQEFLDATDAICENYDGKSSNKDALEAIWEGFETKYDGLADIQKSQLRDPDMYGCGDTIKNAMERYDYLTGKYGLNNFITGRVPTEFRGSFDIDVVGANSNTTMIIIVAIATVSAVSLAALLIIKKRKHN